MSSMRNAVQRRNYRERAQPAQRNKWGVLEKHKDYSLRAKDYNEKKKRLKILREKAAERNPDEFSYGMLSSKTDRYGRRIQERGNPTLDQDTVKLLKTQDAGYLNTVIQETRRKRQKLEQSFHLLNEEGIQIPSGGIEVKNGVHVLFADSPDEQQTLQLARRSASPILSPEQSPPPTASYDDSQPGQEELRGTKHLHVLRAEVEKMNVLKQARAVRKLWKRQIEGRESMIKALKSREMNLVAAEQELSQERARMSNSVGGVNKAGTKWKIRERKR